jgi:hypothetical protein
LEYGAVKLPFDIVEKAHVGFEDKNIGLAFRVNIKTAVQPPAENEQVMFQNIEETVWRSTGIKISTIRNRKREILGLAGHEIITRIQGKKGSISWRWEYFGKVSTADHPRISIFIDLQDPALENEAMIIWDKALDSTRYLG